MTLTFESNRRLKLRIAQEAARLIVDEGISDYLTAKTKAAERLNLNGHQLPGNHEIETAINEFHRIYRASIQASHIHELRQIAIEAMSFFKNYAPYVIGGIVDGSAGRYSPITLHLHTDYIEEILIRLENAHIPFTQTIHVLTFPQKKSEEFPEIGFVVDKIQVTAVIFPSRFVFNPPFGKAVPRLNLSAIKELQP